jgi:hypothetical protein
MYFVQHLKEYIQAEELVIKISASRAEASNKSAALKFTQLKCQRVNPVINIGAHEGDFVVGALRENKKIPLPSYKPLRYVFEWLSQTFRNFDKWKVHNLALGYAGINTEINVSTNRTASSLVQTKCTGSGHAAKSGNCARHASRKI